MKNLLFYMYSFSVLIGMISFSLNKKHLLTMLLCLEFIMIGLFLMLFYFLNLFNFEMMFLLMFLTFSVCEGALGLSILVSMIRTHGNDYFQSYNIL